jgi:hypothetical protein
MTATLTPDELQLLGCPDGQVHAHSSIALTASEALARDSRVVVPGAFEEFLTSPEAQSEMARIALPVAERAHVTLRVHPWRPRFAELASDDCAALTIEGEGTASGPARHVVYLDLGVPGFGVVTTADGQLLVFRRPGPAAAEVDAWLVAPSTLQVAPLAPLDPPLAEWRAGATAPWLRARLERLAGQRDAWSRAVAAGLLALHGEPPTGVRVRVWARGLGPAERETLEDLAMARASRLHDVLADLEDDLTPSAEGWRARLRSLCLARDELDGVVVLLGETARPNDLLTAIGDLDAEAGDFFEALPQPPFIDDDQLRAAGDLDPEAWWGQRR